MNLCPPRDELHDYITRVHRLDRSGIPWPDPIIGRGALAFQARQQDDDGDFGPLRPPTFRLNPLTMGLRTVAAALPAVPVQGREGPGEYAVEVFAPANDHRWIYYLFPRLAGAVLRVPDREGRHLLAVTGTAYPNEMVPALVSDFTRSDTTATMYVAITSHDANRMLRTALDLAAAPKGRT